MQLISALTVSTYIDTMLVFQHYAALDDSFVLAALYNHMVT